MENIELYQQLEKIAYQKSTPFCYLCYKAAPTGICSTCSSNDLMRQTESGCEFGVDWIVKELLEESLTQADCKDAFEEMIEDCYGNTVTVGFMKLSTIDVMKNQDFIAWGIAVNEYISQLEEDEQLISFDNGSTHYWVYDVENYIQENEQTKETA